METILSTFSIEQLRKLYGPQEKNIDVVRSYFKVEIVYRDGEFLIICDDEKIKKEVCSVLQYMMYIVLEQKPLQVNDVLMACRLSKQSNLEKLKQLCKEVIGQTRSGKLIHPKSLNQAFLYKCMKEKDIVFALGVAGTGKTYLSVVYAVSLLKKQMVDKIIITRPAVEAGESLGFLPGDLKEKVDPYLRPLYDALHDMLGVEATQRMIDKNVIEIAPLAYMRGRTLENAFIILDEAQNASKSQLKMFLTRMGKQSKIVITGDASQVDLIKKKESALSNAKDILGGIDEIAFVEMSSVDVVRHPIVQKVIEAYQKYEK